MVQVKILVNHKCQLFLQCILLSFWASTCIKAISIPTLFTDVSVLYREVIGNVYVCLGVDCTSVSTIFRMDFGIFAASVIFFVLNFTMQKYTL